MSDPTSPTTPDAAAPDVLAAVERKALSLLAGTTPGRIDVHRCDADSGAIDYQLQRAPGTPATVLGYATDSDGSSRAKADATLWASAHEMTTAVLTFATEVRRLTATLARLRAPADLAATFPGATARPWAQFILRLPTVGAAPVVARPTALVFGPGDVPVCDTCDRGSLEYRGGPATATEVANAALIVAAVNAHDGLIAENARLLALLAAEREGRAAEVAGARAAALREAAAACANLADGYGATDSDAMAFACADAIDALATKGAPDV